MIGPEEKTPIEPITASENLNAPEVLTEEEFKDLAHLPLWILFYLTLQKQVSSTPVTALELAAYLGIEVKVAEGLLSSLAEQGIVRAFRDDLPAYSLAHDLSEISAKQMMEMVAEIRNQFKEFKQDIPRHSSLKSNEKYRKIYSELASEILQLFGEESANQLPV